MEKTGRIKQSQKMNKKTFSVHGCTKSLKQQHDCLHYCIRQSKFIYIRSSKAILEPMNWNGPNLA